MGEKDGEQSGRLALPSLIGLVVKNGVTRRSATLLGDRPQSSIQDEDRGDSGVGLASSIFHGPSRRAMSLATPMIWDGRSRGRMG